MASEPFSPFKETLKLLRRSLFNYELTLQEIDRAVSTTSEYTIDKLARKDGFKSGLEYLQARFTQYVVVTGVRVKAYPEKLYDTENLHTIYNLHVRTKDPKAKQLSNPTRENETFKPAATVQPVQSPAPAPPATRTQPFTFQGDPHDVEITRLSQPVRAPEPYREPPRVPPPRVAPPPGLSYQDQHPLLPPGLAGPDYYERVPARADSSRGNTGFNTDEHKYVPPNPTLHYRDIAIPEPLAESEEMHQAQKIMDIFPPMPTKTDLLKTQIMSKYFRKLNEVASALENIRVFDFKPRKEYLKAKTPRDYYTRIILALCNLTDGGNNPFEDSLANAIHRLPWLTLRHESGMTYADLVKVLKAVPDYFEIYETEKYNIPTYGIKIKLPMSWEESQPIMDQLMPDIPVASYIVDDKGFTSGVVIETKNTNHPYAIRFTCNEDKYNKLAAALMKFSDGQIVQQTYPFMIVLVEVEFMYYRGRVITISDTKIRIEFIDYGGTLNVEPSKLYVMPPKFAEYESLAVPAEYISGNLSVKPAKDKAIKQNCSKVLKLRIIEDNRDHVCFKVA
uniref:Tudor domain-containing protein n=1 Tax=Panagrellus redivivus TaxID=6233 RepID=A0A7E4V636_PANRE